MLESKMNSFLLGTVVGLAGVALVQEFRTFEPGYTYATFPEIPTHFKLADRLIEPFMKRKRIYAHHWHWEDIPFDARFKEYKQVLPNAGVGNPQNNPFFGAIAHLGGRPLGYLLDLDREDPRTQGVKDFFVGFNWDGAEIMRRCKLKLTKQFFMMAGPDTDCNVYAMDETGNPLPLKKLTGLIHRNTMPAGVRIL
jgi:hypothetical protein